MPQFLQHGSDAFIIDHLGRDHKIDLSVVDFYIAQKKYTVKVEGLENHFTEYLPGTVHCFVSFAGAPSFLDHRDSCDVEIVCIEGTKTMIVDGTAAEVAQGTSLKIPANVLHRATNKFDAIVLSIGREHATR